MNAAELDAKLTELLAPNGFSGIRRFVWEATVSISSRLFLSPISGNQWRSVTIDEGQKKNSITNLLQDSLVVNRRALGRESAICGTWWPTATRHSPRFSVFS